LLIIVITHADKNIYLLRHCKHADLSLNLSLFLITDLGVKHAVLEQHV